ncbi:hydroxyethylthiazole kinase [Actibacterium ureilyticum]|uniref:hydroxyethylthiazole kinase n=1 Tax=Actibacterium ureilyticum TaxID=1590614 RepID=UPI000BAAC4BE
MRAAAPLVQNITNYVSMNVMANVLLAAGAAPAMVHARQEAAEFAGLAGALNVNIGTLSPDWVLAMEAAAKAARDAGTPWGLDPVAAGATGYRREVSARLLALGPDVIRGNASEILALAGDGGAGRGVDAGDPVAAAEAAARALALRTGGVVIASGAVDFVTDGTRAARVSNGHALMARVTALGCSLSALVMAFVAAGDDPFDAAVAALAYYGLAGERAAEAARGPGSFAVGFLDALAAIDAVDLRADARVELL